MLEESDAGLSHLKDDEERASSPLTSDIESSGESAGEPEPDIAHPPSKKKEEKLDLASVSVLTFLL